MMRMILLFVFTLFFSGLCQQVINNSPYFLPNHQDCGLRKVISSDIRTLHPWTVAVYTRQSSNSPWQYLTTGAVISPTAVITIFGGGFGQPPPGDSGKKYKIPSPNNVMVVAGLITTDLIETDANAQYAPVSYIAPCSNSSKPNDEDYHLVVIKLAKPFDFKTPYVRPVCVPFVLKLFFDSFGIGHLPNVRGTTSGFYSPYGRGFYNTERQNGPHYASIVAPGLSTDEAACKNYVKFYYKAHSRDLACGTLLPEGLSNQTCLTHGSAGLWESTRAVINLEPSLGPNPRFFIMGLLALVPRRETGRCKPSEFGILALLRSSFDYVKGHMKCPPTTFPCTFEDRCIELSSVCDGIKDCQNGADEDPTFCRATSKCDPDNEYQCGLYGKCIEKSKTHDGNKDCPSGSDENPKLALVLSSRKLIGRAQATCYPLQLAEGVEAKCTDALGKTVNCTNAPSGTDITLACATYYSPAQRAVFIKRTCYEDRTWKPVRSFSCEPECGLWGESLINGGFIANGEKGDHATRFPWHALIFRETSVGSDDFVYTCGGSLIERNIIVTAAHCTVDARGVPLVPQTLKVVMNAPSADFQENDKNVTTQIFQVEQFWSPWSFNIRTLDSDIAILHLKTPAKYNNYVRPICYLLGKTQKPPADYSTGKVPGFGLTEDGELSVDLKYIELNVTKSDECGLEALLEKFCAKASKAGSVCYGDSGGGIVFPVKDKQFGAYELKGVVSTWNNGRARCGKEAIATSFTNVDAYTEWMLSIIEEIDTNPDS